jgi:hypothetical protein
MTDILKHDEGLYLRHKLMYRSRFSDKIDRLLFSKWERARWWRNVNYEPKYAQLITEAFTIASKVLKGSE